MNIDSAYKISVIILLLSTLISSLELMSIPRVFVDFVYPTTNIKEKYRLWVMVHLLQGILALVTGFVFYFSFNIYFHIFFVALAALTLYSYSIRTAGKDGSDQLRILALLAYSLCFLLNNENGRLIALLFTALQVLISYTTSGLVKIFSSHWRKGNVLSGVLSTYSYGIPAFSKKLSANPVLEKVMTYFAIFSMFAVALSFLVPYQTPLLIALAMILGFHFSTAILMGLNDFLFTFPLAYPGILLLHSLIYKHQALWNYAF